MTRVCTICTHPERERIDLDLVRRDSYRAIACRYSVGRESLRRHTAEHLPALLAEAHQAERVAEATRLLDRIDQKLGLIEKWIDKADRGYNPAVLARFLGEWRSFVELLAKVSRQLDERPVVNLTVSVEWLELKATIRQALAPHPEAQRAVLQAIAGKERTNGRS